VIERRSGVERLAGSTGSVEGAPPETPPEFLGRVVGTIFPWKLWLEDDFVADL
jgi:hypothetical protein